MFLFAFKNRFRVGFSVGFLAVLSRGEVLVATSADFFVSFQSDLLITKNDRPIGNASHPEKRIKVSLMT